jgi:hypothetical protein
MVDHKVKDQIKVFTQMPDVIPRAERRIHFFRGFALPQKSGVASTGLHFLFAAFQHAFSHFLMRQDIEDQNWQGANRNGGKYDSVIRLETDIGKRS